MTEKLKESLVAFGYQHNFNLNYESIKDEKKKTVVGAEDPFYSDTLSPKETPTDFPQLSEIYWRVKQILRKRSNSKTE